MDHYLIWCNLKNTSKDVAFCSDVDAYLGHLQEQGLIEGHLIMRRKLGLGPAQLGEFLIDIQTRDLAQLERAWALAAERTGGTDKLHFPVYTAAKDLSFALYRDFPDPFRRKGSES